jgi:glycosyltransferase involved in cell wall biosynthesis
MLHILLSTYNGQTYLEELLRSVLRQTYGAFQLHVRDDGSTDNTLNILRKYQSQDERILVESGPNIGVQGSFYNLLEGIEDAIGFYAFCDQDDIWGEQKLEAAVRAIQSSREPAASLYFSRLSCVDMANQHLYDSQQPIATGIYNALVQNSAIGCTCVFGSRIRAEFLRADPADMIMHDWWLYLCAASRGRLIYDDTPRVRYRQHENTATPREPGISRLVDRFQRLLGRLNEPEKGLESLTQANAFLATYPDCDTRIRSTLERLNNSHGFTGILRRLGFVLNTPLHRNDPLETLSLKLVILFDLY